VIKSKDSCKMFFSLYFYAAQPRGKLFNIIIFCQVNRIESDTREMIKIETRAFAGFDISVARGEIALRWRRLDGCSFAYQNTKKGSTSRSIRQFFLILGRVCGGAYLIIIRYHTSPRVRDTMSLLLLLCGWTTVVYTIIIIRPPGATRVHATAAAPWRSSDFHATCRAFRSHLQPVTHYYIIIIIIITRTTTAVMNTYITMHGDGGV